MVSLTRMLGRWARAIMNTVMTAPKTSVARCVMGLALRVTVIVLDGTGEAALRSLFKSLKIGTAHISA